MAAEKIVALLRFEEPAGMPAADDIGAIDDMFPPAGMIAPTKEDGPVGLAAVFALTGPTGLQAVELDPAATLLPRDLTVQAIVRWDIAQQDTDGTPGTIIARGLGTGGVESMPFALELNVVDVATRLGEVRWLWHTAAGVLKTETGGSFVVPSGYVIITATRRWVSPTEVWIRYYANDHLLLDVSTADGDIAAFVDGTITIGTRYDGAYTNVLDGAIDELAIYNYEMCAEEVSAIVARITDHQLDSLRVIHDLMPPGIPISDDPASAVQSDLASMAAALGFAGGQIENIRNNTMPDRAYGNIQRRWEGITRQPPKQGDSLDRRRTRVLGHLGSRGGVSVPSVQRALAEALDCLPTDLEVIAFDNTIRDDFATIDEQRWLITAGVTAVAGEMKIAATGAPDPAYTWDETSIRGSVARSALLPVEPPRSSSIGNPLHGVSIFGYLDPHTLPANAEAGFVFWSDTGDHALFFGLRNVAGAYKVGYQRFEFGAATDPAFVVLATTALQKHYLRIRPTDPQGSIGAAFEKVDLSYSTTDFAEASFTTSAGHSWMRGFQYAGMYMRSTAALGSAVDVRFGDFAFRNEFGTRPYYWYVFRDPILGGTPDIVGANRIIERMRHAFTYAKVITDKSLLCDDPASVCDGGPMGCL